jgi:Phage terminase, small subunit
LPLSWPQRAGFDRGPLAAYCTAYALWVEAVDALQKYGAMIKSPTGYPVQSPYLATANRQVDVMIRIAGEFGFTPASRSDFRVLQKAARCCWSSQVWRIWIFHDWDKPTERMKVINLVHALCCRSVEAQPDSLRRKNERPRTFRAKRTVREALFGNEPSIRPKLFDY